MITNNFLERLEELAFEKKKCEIIFSDEGGSVVIFDRIEGVYERDINTVLQLRSGKEIPLDKLLAVDGTYVEKLS